MASDRGSFGSLELEPSGIKKPAFPYQAIVKQSLTVQLVSKTYKFASHEEQCRQIEAAQPTSDFDQTVEQVKKFSAVNPKRVRKGDTKA